MISGVTAFVVVGIDKDRAIRRECRIPERTLFIVALIGGSFGMALGTELFRHKSSKLSFLAVLYAIVGIWLFLLLRVGFLGCLESAILP